MHETDGDMNISEPQLYVPLHIRPLTLVSH